jgi:hypothetical protein
VETLKYLYLVQCPEKTRESRTLSANGEGKSISSIILTGIISVRKAERRIVDHTSWEYSVSLFYLTLAKTGTFLKLIVNA